MVLEGSHSSKDIDSSKYDIESLQSLPDILKSFIKICNYLFGNSKEKLEQRKVSRSFSPQYFAKIKAL